MNSMLGFYKQTWWLWLLFVAVFVVLAKYVTVLFLLMIPGIVLYSVYFGVVRVSELNEADRARRVEELRRQTPPTSPGSAP